MRKCTPACGTLGASRPLSGPHSASKSLCSALLLCLPTSLIFPCWNFMSGTVSQLSCLCVSSDPGCALGAVGYLCAGDVVIWIRCPEKNIINHQYKSSHRHAEEIDNRHRHFHPNLCWHVGVFGPQLSGIARPPLHVPVQLLGGRGDLSTSRFHIGRLLRGTTRANDAFSDSCLVIRVRTAEPAAPFSPSTIRFWSCTGAEYSLSRKSRKLRQGLPKACLKEVKSLVPQCTVSGENWTQGGRPWHQLDGTVVKVTLLNLVVSGRTIQSNSLWNPAH